jgi:hypothetical protein
MSELLKRNPVRKLSCGILGHLPSRRRAIDAWSGECGRCGVPMIRSSANSWVPVEQDRD